MTLKSLQAIYAYRGGNQDMPREQLWLHYLASAEERIVNYERISSLQELADANPVLDYVQRSLELLQPLRLSFWMKDILEEVLIWSETAKGGSVKERIGLQEQGINCFVHNIGSAQIYLRHAGQPGSERTRVIHTLIRTHGLIGQQLRGEVPAEDNLPLSALVKERLLAPEELYHLLTALNYCIIGAVSEELWVAVKADAKRLIEELAYEQQARKMSWSERLRLLRAAPIAAGEDYEGQLAAAAKQTDLHGLLSGMEDKTFWYVESALGSFSLEQFLKVMALALHGPGSGEVRHISFEPLMNTMYYDYKGVKKINVYKQRMMEHYLKQLTWEQLSQGDVSHGGVHLQAQLERKDALPDTIFFNLAFSAAAEKLIEFCIEAEKSPLYEKAVLLLFDLFGLRRDAYDRFHNEETYLATMNGTVDYKRVLLDYIVGRKVLDIGPGGGVLLDLMERELPDVEPIGIDISHNVIEALDRKRQLEGHRWTVLQGDAMRLKEYIEPGSVGTVIFSSIIHELYSYIPYEGRRFNRDTISAALVSAFEVLEPGGRLIIRDGIMTEPVSQLRRIRFLDSEGMDWLERYAEDFEGREITFERLAEDEVLMPVNDAMEFLYTYTWGEESYVHEVQEQFGYFTPSEYRECIDGLFGEEGRIMELRHYLQEGYTEALAAKVQIMDEQGESVSLPDSTCLIVVEKVKPRS
ncbi:class I SAM-dependent methyltransferase [Paenibacillus sp. SYP-B4298]|uniref:class I SAM-dependent methyltransferase n=1 Tax=Paenibacillus sp. SYP-B4298 TaxID=2996034 RepID=UPI0022DD443A|nr:class I SAM-dependent methyltransferase [Paenibacillus sp. SYP-B4298]